MYLSFVVVGCEGEGFEIFVRPFYAVAIADIIRHYGWQDIWYLYSNDEGWRHHLAIQPRSRIYSGEFINRAPGVEIQSPSVYEYIICTSYYQRQRGSLPDTWIR